MAQAESMQIRNVALVDHEGAGETTLVEAMLKQTSTIQRMGHIKDHNTVSDFDPDEQNMEKSYYCSTISFPYRDLNFNLLDIPGSPDCIGEALTALHAVECALVCVDACDGIRGNTRKMWQMASQLGLPRIIAITRLDAESTDFWKTLKQIKEEYGNRCIPLYVPDGSSESFSRVYSVLHDKDANENTRNKYEKIVEAIVETDDELMVRYLEGEDVLEEDLLKALKNALMTGSLFPVVPTAAEKEIGTKELLNLLAELAPAHNEIKHMLIKDDEEISSDGVKGFSGYVYHTAADEFVTRISHVRILSGSLAGNSGIINRRSNKFEKVGHLFKIIGKEQEEIGNAVAGDIIAIPKIEDMHAGDVITDDKTNVRMEDIKFPVPMASVAVQPKTRKDEQKISSALHDLENDDRTFHVHSDPQTGDLIISGMSDAHLDLMLRKLKRRHRVEVDVSSPKIPYRETITTNVKNVEYTHKKQSGGAGQFGRVFINLEPVTRGAGYEFIDKIYGGAIDTVFRTSVNKGIQARMAEGILAGYPVADVKVTLIDGKTHPVDSKDIAFQIAGKEVFKKAFLQCSPAMLEPIVRMEVSVPPENIGDIIGDLNSKRGKILSSDPTGTAATIRALVPLAEIQSYQAQLKSMTSGEGSYSVEFDHYDFVPPNIQKKIIAEHERG
ncbi:MAG: elongation factor G [Mariprofundaceae bacterium]